MTNSEVLGRPYPEYKRMRYASSDDFFRLGGSVWMQLARAAGIEVMLTAVNHGLVVLGYEAGIWHDPRLFEARIDGIMSAPDPYAVSEVAVAENNRWMAFDLRDDCPAECDAVIVTTALYPYPRPQNRGVRHRPSDAATEDRELPGVAVGLRRPRPYRPGEQ